MIHVRNVRKQLDHVRKQLDRKDNVNLKIYDVTPG